MVIDKAFFVPLCFVLCSHYDAFNSKVKNLPSTKHQVPSTLLCNKYIWLVPLLPLIGAAINGIFGRWFRFPEKLWAELRWARLCCRFDYSRSSVLVWV